MNKILNHWMLKPPVKFYGDYTPFQRAWWGLWKRPAGLLTHKQRLELNKAFIEKMTSLKKPT